MTTHRRNRIARRRYGRSDTRRVRSRAGAPKTAGMLDRVLALSPLDHALGRLLGHPRALQVAGILVGIAAVALALRPLIWTFPVPTVPAVASSGAAPTPAPAVAPLARSAANDAEGEVMNVVAAYNQASITAALLGRVDVMAPYLAPDGTTWAEVQAEYQRRAMRGETHDPALTRWGVLRMALDGDTAIVETQEQWDDVMSVGGQVITSKRGILTRNTYTLRHSPGFNRWLITSVASTTIVN